MKKNLLEHTWSNMNDRFVSHKCGAWMAAFGSPKRNSKVC